MGRVAVFVDAGYFWVQACQAVLGRKGTRKDISVDYSLLRTCLLEEVGKQTKNAELLRVYWYDGPSQSSKGPDHESIEDLDDFKLRLGTRNSTGQQKAVDGLIIADMLSLTQSKAIDHAVLLSGDADLTPGVTAAQAMGLRVHLFILEPRGATSPYLAAEADGKLLLNVEWAKGFANISATASLESEKRTIQNPEISQMSSTQRMESDSASIHSLPLEMIAQRVHTNIMSSSLAALAVTITKGSSPLPKEIDSKLLFQGKIDAGRTLTELEKRSLRVVFKNLF